MDDAQEGFVLVILASMKLNSAVITNIRKKKGFLGNREPDSTVQIYSTMDTHSIEEIIVKVKKYSNFELYIHGSIASNDKFIRQITDLMF